MSYSPLATDHIFVRLVLESLRKDAGDGNEDGKKAILGLQPRDKAAMLGSIQQKFCSKN